MNEKGHDAVDETLTVVGITGASGSGKSFLAGRIRDRLTHQLEDNKLPTNRVAVITEDCYYRGQDHLSVSDRNEVNYDHPDSLEHDLLARQLGELRARRSIEVPQYDYAQHSRKAETLTIQPPTLLIVEGILILSQKEIRDQVDLKIFIDVPLEVCLQRRVKRDVHHRGRTRESVVEQFETTVRPMFEKFTLPAKEYADLIVPMHRENPAAIEVLVDHLVGVLRI